MKTTETILEAVGNTPLIKLRRMFDEKKMATIYGKCEHLLPSGSVKDRIALHILESAEKEGRIKPGGTIIEATAGNTGMSFAMVAAVKGYRTIFVMPDKFSDEKVNMLKAYGSEVVKTPTSAADDDPESWRQVAKRLSKEIANSLLVGQFENQHNVEAHYRATGPEIWEQTDGNIDAFVAAAGSGGTIVGAGRYLKEKAKEAGRELRTVVPDPIGSCYYDAFYKKEAQGKKPWLIEGVGNDFVPEILDFSVIDEVRKIGDRESFHVARQIVREEGLFVGGTAGANVAVAMEVARELGPGKTVVTILCDSGNRYMSKLFNDEWMRDHGFAGYGLSRCRASISEILNFKGKDVEVADPTESISSVATRMASLGISQMPVPAYNDRGPMMVHESDLLHSLLEGGVGADEPISQVATELKGIVKPDDDIAILERVFERDNVAVVTSAENAFLGIICKIDVVKFLAAHASVAR